MLLSVIIVTKNDEDGLMDTLNSLEPLPTDDTEIIICDGADNVEPVTKIVESFNRYCIIAPGPDQGIYSGMARGLKVAKGNVVWFLNGGDTAIEPINSYLLARILQKSSRTWTIGLQNNPNMFLSLNKHLLNLSKYFLNYGVRPIPHQSTLFKRYIFSQLEYESNYGLFADQAFMFKLINRDKPFFAKLVISKHRVGGIGDHQSFGSFRRQMKSLRIQQSEEFFRPRLKHFLKILISYCLFLAQLVLHLLRKCYGR